jgi:hypothetical protein
MPCEQIALRWATVDDSGDDDASDDGPDGDDDADECDE